MLPRTGAVSFFVALARTRALERLRFVPFRCVARARFVCLDFIVVAYDASCNCVLMESCVLLLIVAPLYFRVQSKAETKTVRMLMMRLVCDV